MLLAGLILCEHPYPNGSFHERAHHRRLETIEETTQKYD